MSCTWKEARHDILICLFASLSKHTSRRQTQRSRVGRAFGFNKVTDVPITTGSGFVSDYYHNVSLADLSHLTRSDASISCSE